MYFSRFCRLTLLLLSSSLVSCGSADEPSIVTEVPESKVQPVSDDASDVSISEVPSGSDTPPAPVTEPVSEPEPQLMPEPVLDPIPEPDPEPIPEPVPEPIPEPVLDPMPEPVPEPLPEPVLDPIPEPTPEPIPGDDMAVDGVEEFIRDDDNFTEPTVFVSGSISWQIPLQREDGSPLTQSEISAYRIYYGDRLGDYQNVIEISSPELTQVDFHSFLPGRHYAVMTTLDKQYRESRYSAVIEINL